MTPQKRSDDISPYYKAFGWFLATAAVINILVAQWRTTALTWIDFAVVVALIVGALALVRPRAFDQLVKRGADMLPWTKYKLPPEG